MSSLQESGRHSCSGPPDNLYVKPGVGFSRLSLRHKLILRGTEYGCLAKFFVTKPVRLEVGGPFTESNVSNASTRSFVKLLDISSLEFFYKCSTIGPGKVTDLSLEYRPSPRTGVLGLRKDERTYETRDIDPGSVFKGFPWFLKRYVL